MAFAVGKVQPFSRDDGMPISANTLPEHYWSPELDVIKQRDYPESLWLEEATAQENTVSMPNFEHLRKSTCMTSFGKYSGAGFGYACVFDYTTVDSYAQTGSVNFGANMQGKLGVLPDDDSDSAEIAYAATLDIKKVSPVGTRTNAPLR